MQYENCFILLGCFTLLSTSEKLAYNSPDVSSLYNMVALLQVLLWLSVFCSGRDRCLWTCCLPSLNPVTFLSRDRFRVTERSKFWQHSTSPKQR